MSGGYAPNGDILVHSDSVMGDWAFSYDQLDRLSTAVAVGNQGAQYGGVSAGYAGLLGCWSYDAFGNRLSEAMSTTACGSNPGTLSWATYNANDSQMATSSYALGGVGCDASGAPSPVPKCDGPGSTPTGSNLA